MAVKQDKSRIMFTTDNSFELFLKDRCYKENRNMSNLVDTILKNHYEIEYSEYVKSVDESIKDILRNCCDNIFYNQLVARLSNPKVSLASKLSAREMIINSTDDVNVAIVQAFGMLEKELTKDIIRIGINKED